MAQAGLHALVGMGLVEVMNTSPRTRISGPTAFGVVLGSILPDTDFIAAAPVYFCNHNLALHFHRTFTHSLLVIVLATVLGYFIAKNPGKRALAVGIGVGMALHSLLDVFLWYSPVDLLWPLGLFGLPSSVNLWQAVEPSRLTGALLAAGDFAFLSIFFAWLIAKSRRCGQGKSVHSALGKLTWVTLACTPVSFILVISLPGSVCEVIQYGAFALFILPAGLWAVAKMRSVIERSRWETETD